MTTLTAFAIIRLTWAKRIESFDQIPAAFLSFFENLGLRDAKPFPFVIQTPAYEKKNNEKLVCLIGGKLYILGRERNKISSACYDFKDISFIESGSELLYSWIAISGFDNLGRLTFSKAEFNTVTEHLFDPIFQLFRPVSDYVTDAQFTAEKANFDFLFDKNYKYMNYARRSIRRGQKIIQTIFQPEMRVIIFSLYGKTFYRTITPAHIIILTDNELITITDVERPKWGKDEGYRSIWHYIPLNKIHSVSQIEKDESLFSLSIFLPENETLSFVLQPDKKQDVELLQDKISALANKNSE
jgi:hypothetical protein